MIEHGQLIEFLSHLRCEACQAGNHKCITQENDERCLICTGADGPCIFSRTVAVRGSKTAFKWAQLRHNDIPDSIWIDEHNDSSTCVDTKTQDLT